MQRFFTAEQLENIVERRRQGEPWAALAAEVKMTPAGLRHHIKRLMGTIILNSKECPYCKTSFTPLRKDSVHCGHPDCYLQHRKDHWTKWGRNHRLKTEPKKNESTIECIGNYCGGKSFRTPLVNDHGRKRPLYRLCPICRARNTEYCLAWGGA